MSFVVDVLPKINTEFGAISEDAEAGESSIVSYNAACGAGG